MASVVRAIDVGFGNTKFVEAVVGEQIRCTHFPSVARVTDEHAKRDAIGGRRKTVALAIDGLVYEVGPEVNLTANVFQARPMDERYCERPEYLALARGALGMMGVDRVDILVLGLPVATFKHKRQVLEKRMKAEHDVGDGRRVRVERVKVVTQPIGALVHYGVTQGRMAQIRDERNLIIDPGAGTFDWLVTQGMRVIENRSHSVNRGMYDVVRKLAEGIGRVEGVEVTDYERIDVALRTRTKPRINGAEYDLSKHMRAAKTVAEEAVAEMKHYVGNGHDIDNIVLVGGGAFFFKDAIQSEYPKHRLRQLGDGLYANVKGFQLAGMELARGPERGAQEEPAPDELPAATTDLEPCAERE